MQYRGTVEVEGRGTTKYIVSVVAAAVGRGSFACFVVCVVLGFYYFRFADYGDACDGS